MDLQLWQMKCFEIWVEVGQKGFEGLIMVYISLHHAFAVTGIHTYLDLAIPLHDAPLNPIVCGLSGFSLTTTLGLWFTCE